MPRRMSCALTVDRVLDRTKTVTRRAPATWSDLKPGDRLTLIEKGMGLPKGAKQVVLAEVEIVDVRIEGLGAVAGPGELEKEGFPDMTAFEFESMWARTHGSRNCLIPSLIPCRRIEWRYL